MANGIIIDPGAVGILPYICADVNADGGVDIADIVYMVEWMFYQPPGPEPQPLESADLDASGEIDIADLVYFVEYSFGQPPGPAPVCGTEITKTNFDYTKKELREAQKVLQDAGLNINLIEEEPKKEPKARKKR